MKLEVFVARNRNGTIVISICVFMKTDCEMSSIQVTYLDEVLKSLVGWYDAGQNADLYTS